MTSRLAEKLRDPEYRKAFVASQINIGIPFQIRAMLKNRPGWTQATIANRAQMLQPRISGLMTPGKTRPNIDTLRRIAEAFDCGLVVRFAPFSEMAKWSDEFDPDSFSVPDFDHDAGFIERKGPDFESQEAYSEIEGTAFSKSQVVSIDVRTRSATLQAGGGNQVPIQQSCAASGGM
jgi:transcriptional regulator with XRE-family HTH domain